MSRSRRGRRRGSIVRRLAAVVLVLAVAVGAGVWWVRRQFEPVSAGGKPVLVRIKSGMGPGRIAETLRERGVIRSARAFRWYAARNGDSSRFKAGQYRLSPSMTLDEIIARLKKGRTDADIAAVTIPEGYTAPQIAEALAAKGVLRDPDAFVSLVRSRDSGVVAPFALPKAGLEGYLFPDTYHFLPNSHAERVAQAMVDAFAKQFYEPHRMEIETSGHSLNEIVTIASMIEREAEVPRDRAKIAGVIENRLKRGMKLDIDATVLYALGHHKSRVLYSDLQVDSPYNTYRHKGLPPGPIASPGLPALEAALHPEPSDYLFYVAGPGGAHIFSRTEAEHNAVVARLRSQRQRDLAARRGAG